MQIDQFLSRLNEWDLDGFRPSLDEAIAVHFKSSPHGRLDEWNLALDALPLYTTKSHNLATNTVAIGRADELKLSQADLAERLKAFKPWRKGPFNLFGVHIDTEWRSDFKWQRIAPHLSPLKGKRVLDIGCGNGYHMMRMLGEGAELALGADPTVVFLYQFAALTRFMSDIPAAILPLRCEQLPAFGSFDTVFSMGVLYHRKSPLDHLRELSSFMTDGGELILETLVIEEKEETALEPKGRYAKMANVFSIPSTRLLERQVQEAGFTEVRTVDVTRTTRKEQRATEWMTFQSLADFLDPKDQSKTVEGLPAPVRATVIAKKPA